MPTTRGALLVLAAQCQAFVLYSRTRVPAMIATTATREEAAKREWLSRLDVPWDRGVVAPAGASTSSAGALPRMGEEEAKKAWLARLDAPTWGKLADSATEASVIAENTSGEDEVKKLDVNAAAKAVSAVAAEMAAYQAVAAGSMSAEDIAKQKWLARLDVPSWGSDKAAAAQNEEKAKRAWLARLDAPSWGKGAEAMAAVVQEATAIQEMNKACDRGDEQACESLSHEEAAKKAWLERLDVPAWGAAAAAVSAVATQVGA